MTKLSVVLATFNEEKNLADCLNSIKEIADEIVIVDGSSTDKTVEIAHSFMAKVLVKDNPPIFHINKQKALEIAKNEWILQLDADERVSLQLREEIIKIINMSEQEIEKYENNLPHKKLFMRHQQLLEKRDGNIGDQSKQYTAFFVPRLNFFLGKYLRYGGVYPDGVIRLIKKNLAHFPCKNVHEQIAVDGKVGWLQNDLYHLADPTFKRYLQRNSHYINLIADDLEREKIGKNIWQFIDYSLIKSTWWFLLTLLRHKGILDGFQGFIFSFFSALRFPRAYFRYLTGRRP
ncbi:MAG: glycosyltransferase family 2 protein [Candidatus Daviesbacteria bacterium]|nr:glycosyltransferase family 2 protein [Candidatus Daviesbacteria bacterium]